MKSVITRLSAVLVVALAVSLSAARADDSVIVGAQFNGTTTTPVGAYVKDLGSGSYLLTGIQITNITIRPTIHFQTVATADYAYDFSQLLPPTVKKHVSLLALAGPGVSAGAESITRAFEGGGIGVIHTPHFDVVLGARVVNSGQLGTTTIPVAGVLFHLK